MNRILPFHFIVTKNIPFFKSHLHLQPTNFLPPFYRPTHSILKKTIKLLNLTKKSLPLVNWQHAVGQVYGLTLTGAGIRGSMAGPRPYETSEAVKKNYLKKGKLTSLGVDVHFLFII